MNAFTSLNLHFYLNARGWWKQFSQFSPWKLCSIRIATAKNAKRGNVACNVPTPPSQLKFFQITVILQLKWSKPIFSVFHVRETREHHNALTRFVPVGCCILTHQLHPFCLEICFQSAVSESYAWPLPSTRVYFVCQLLRLAEKFIWNCKSAQTCQI